jgi:hypothetical protein
LTELPSQTRGALVGLAEAGDVAEGAGRTRLPVVAGAVGAEEPLGARPLGRVGIASHRQLGDAVVAWNMYTTLSRQGKARQGKARQITLMSSTFVTGKFSLYTHYTHIRQNWQETLYHKSKNIILLKSLK